MACGWSLARRAANFFEGSRFLQQGGDFRIEVRCDGSVVLRLQVQHQDVLALLGVEAGAGLLPQRALLDQGGQPLGRLEVLVPRVVGQRIGHGLDDVGHRVQAHDVGRAVGGGLGPPDGRAGECVHGIEAKAQLLGVVHRRQHRENANAVADEVRCVLGDHYALAERGGEERFEFRQDGRGGRLGRDQLGQVHVAGRVEEVHAQEPREHGFGQYVGQRVDAQARRIAGEDGMVSDVRRDLAVEVLLPVHPLGDGFDHQVAAVQQLKPGFVVGRHDPLGQCLVGQRGGAELGQVGDGLVDDAVGVAVLCGQVEQHRVHARIGQVRCDLGAHDAGAEHCCTPHKQFVSHFMQLLENK